LNDVAWIDDGTKRFVARAPADGRLPAESAVTRLIQGIYRSQPGQARRILRRRIRASAQAPSEMCWGMVKVAAKRIECGARIEERSGPAELVEVGGALAADPSTFGLGAPELGSDRLRLREDPMSLALALAASVPVHERRSLSDRRIACVLADRDGRVLAWAVNSSSADKTLHAEVNLVQSYCRATQRPLPSGAQVFTTLKSCKMCAGMIWTAAEDPLSLKVFFAQDDPGPKARRTVLNAGSFERERARPGSDERIEYAF
jgi:tRNA(Arg) A34 adenosine deaminase TadA